MGMTKEQAKNVHREYDKNYFINPRYFDIIVGTLLTDLETLIRRNLNITLRTGDSLSDACLWVYILKGADQNLVSELPQVEYLGMRICYSDMSSTPEAVRDSKDHLS